MPALIVLQGPFAGQRVDITEETVLGRTDNEFLQHDTEVSRRHAVVRSGAEGLTIEDLGSSNGTFVNDQRIEGSTPLSTGDVVRLGRVTLEVEVEAREARTVIRDVPPTAPPPPPAPPADETAPIAQEPPPAEPAAAGVPPPPGPPPAEPSVYGSPPPPPAGDYAASAAAYRAGAKPSVVVAVGIILLIVGIGTLLYNGWESSSCSVTWRRRRPSGSATSWSS